MLKPFLRRSQKSQWKENYTVATLWKPIRSGLDRFLSGSLQRKPFSIIRDYKVHKQANEALNPSLKDLARQELISFTKHKRPNSSEDLEVLNAANQLGLEENWKKIETDAWSPYSYTRTLHVYRERSVFRHVSASRLRHVFCRNLAFLALSKKLYLRLYLTQFIHSNGKMLFAWRKNCLSKFLWCAAHV